MVVLLLLLHLLFSSAVADNGVAGKEKTMMLNWCLICVAGEGPGGAAPVARLSQIFRRHLCPGF